MVTRYLLAASTLLSLLTVATGSAQDTLEERVDQAIERGLQLVRSRQRDNGMFTELDPASFPKPRDGTSPSFPGGSEVMSMCVLAYSSAKPESAEVAKSLDVFMKLPLEQTYTLGFRIIALAEFWKHAQTKTREELRKAMDRDAKALVAIQLANGGWHYAKRDTDKFFDFSNTQVAVLALGLAAECGVEIAPEVFEKAGQLYLNKQRDDGGWDYGHPQFGNTHSYGSMTAAGVANLIVIRDILDPMSGCPCSGSRSKASGNSQVDRAIERGIAWLGGKFSPSTNPDNSTTLHPYWLYSCQRVGIATGMKYFGDHDWYREGAETLIKSQSGSGAWIDYHNTCFGLLFLMKGRGPILMNKLKYDGRWNLHNRDVANLAEYVGQLKEQRMLWQVVETRSPLDELHESPILYITAEEKVELPAEFKATLRRFTDTGGTVLLEASCGNPAGKTFCETLCREVWPEWELKRLDDGHPLWTCDLEIAGSRPVLDGLSDGIRTFVFYSSRNVSCYWQTRAVTRYAASFYVGNNLYAYATDRARLRDRRSHRQVGLGAKYAAEQPSCRATRKELVVARLKHGGRWNSNEHYAPWAVLAEDARARLGLGLREAEPVDIGAAIAKETDIAYLCGRDRMELSDTARAALKTYLSGGGFLLVEATAGDEAFGQSVQEALKAAGLTLTPLGQESPMISGQFGAQATGYAVTAPGWTVGLRTARLGKPLPELYGIHLDGKQVGLYSPFDILYSQTGCRAFGSRGYEPGDARALALNVLLMAATR